MFLSAQSDSTRSVVRKKGVLKIMSEYKQISETWMQIKMFNFKIYSSYILSLRWTLCAILIPLCNIAYQEVDLV